jgi:hypothetical protein
VHVDIDVEAIVRGVREMKEHLQRYESEVRSLRQEKLAAWNRVESDLRTLVGK